MSFAHPDFLPFFGIVLAAFAFVPRRLRVAFLLGASWAFYLVAPTWQFGVLVASTALDYGLGLQLGRTEGARARRALLWTSVVGNIGLLVWSKATGLLAIGLSFYTFQSLSYTIDVYRRRIPVCRDPLRFALFVAFFPQLMAGPIERGRSLLPQLERLGASDTVLFRAKDLDHGARLVLWGLWKKFCLADRLRPWALGIYAAPEGRPALDLVWALLSFNVIIYLDFSAYTDIARGTARGFGVELVRNFRHPYFARSLGDLARRWHTSLLDWIMDYVWAPLVRGRFVLGRVLWANCTVMALFGLWHELRVDLAVLGAALGLVMTLEQLPRLRGQRPPKRGTWFTVGNRVVAGVSWVVFSTALFAPNGASLVDFARALGAAESVLGPDGLRTAAFAVTFGAVGLAVHGLDLWARPEERWARVPGPVRVVVLVVAALVIARFAAPESQDFVYTRF